MSRFRYLRPAAFLAVASCAVTLAVASPSVAIAADWEVQANANPSAMQTATFPGHLAARDDRPPKNSRAGSSSGGSR